MDDIVSNKRELNFCPYCNQFEKHLWKTVNEARNPLKRDKFGGLGWLGWSSHFLRISQPQKKLSIHHLLQYNCVAKFLPLHAMNLQTAWDSEFTV